LSLFPFYVLVRFYSREASLNEGFYGIDYKNNVYKLFKNKHIIQRSDKRTIGYLCELQWEV